MFEEYELICSTNINVTIENNLIDDSRIIYKISNDSANVILKQNGEEKELGSCKSIKNNKKVKKKKWFKKLFGK